MSTRSILVSTVDETISTAYFSKIDAVSTSVSRALTTQKPLS